MEGDLAVILKLPSFSSMDADQHTYIRYDKEVVIVRYILRSCIRGFCPWTEPGSVASRQRFCWLF
jgi:hypothetical protein